jgi:hypothetical protein
MLLSKALSVPGNQIKWMISTSEYVDLFMKDSCDCFMTVFKSHRDIQHVLLYHSLSPPPQSKPLIPLQKEEDPETNKTVLTNYMFPQQTRTEDCEY